jgi:gluconokinase
MSSLVFMGVAGCGKSSVATGVARELGLPLIEGDEFHPKENREKMHNGIALTDADRKGWLEALGTQLAAHPDGVVLTCSALKRAYRDLLRNYTPGLRFVFLDLDREAALQRVAGRGAAHFFSPKLVDSQFATLERPDGEAGVLKVERDRTAAATGGAGRRLGGRGRRSQARAGIQPIINCRHPPIDSTRRRRCSKAKCSARRCFWLHWPIRSLHKRC